MLPQRDFLFGHARARTIPAEAALVADEKNPSHTAKRSQQLADEMGMELLWLPKRAPELNPMDTLWEQDKDIVSANLPYPTIDDHVHAFIEYLESLTNWKAHYTVGILSESFWLKSVLQQIFWLPA